MYAITSYARSTTPVGVSVTKQKQKQKQDKGTEYEGLKPQPYMTINYLNCTNVGF
jgi:hypothetical protein